jgi:hypothetical protein
LTDSGAPGVRDGQVDLKLSSSTVQITFAVAREGTIKLGADGSLSNEITHTLTLNLVRA